MVEFTFTVESHHCRFFIYEERFLPSHACRKLDNCPAPFSSFPTNFHYVLIHRLIAGIHFHYSRKPFYFIVVGFISYTTQKVTPLLF